ncbi:MAG: peptidoglycan bridge formation glycyltransferase FemA/FemB family protein [Anaerolineae bacterium]|nr:peptidoglycan bridge formation glycyltransferase FemA/FemB family protein [Anaerolineae bacterium]
MYTTTLQLDQATWDAFVASHPRAHFLQLSTWGVFKSGFGWTAQQVGLLDKDNGKLIAGAQILYRRLPFRLGSMAYIPFGPLVNWEDISQVKALLKLIDRAARQHRAVFCKIEPGYKVPPELLKKLRHRPSPQTVQPPRTIVLDIGGRDEKGEVMTTEKILARMNQGTRRNIRKSEKFEITVREGSRADVDGFNRLIQTTSERQEFGVHVPEYYEQVYELLIEQKTAPSPIKATLLIASYPDETTGQTKDLAGIFVFALGKRSWYPYGASSNEERQRMAPYAVQWAAIEWARKQGATTYDLYGIPDENEAYLERHFEEREDGLWGVYRFKRGWGGRVVRTIGAWDRVYNPLLYWGYRTYLYFRQQNTSD